jgi:hypothetical protein
LAPSLDGSPVEYLIVTGDALAPEFERLAAWKTAKGVPAVVRTLTQVQSAALHGSDLQETVRNYIRDAYLYWGVRFVLLGGDTDILPPRTVEMELLDLTHPISDLYYACLDGNWNADGDAFIGEPAPDPGNPGDAADLIAEVYVGRAPVSTVAEARVFVDKTLEYEQPQLLDFEERALLLAEVLFPPDYDPAGGPPAVDGALYAEEIQALLPPGMHSTRLYEATARWPGSSPLTLAASLQAMQNGYGTVVHIGHGYRYTLSVGDASMTVGDAAGLANGSRSGLFYMLNCTATAFDFECMAEALLLNPNGGATAVIGAAREAFPVAARAYQREFFEQLYVQGEYQVGVAMTRSRESLLQPYMPQVELWTQLEYTLLGDPELPIWTARPVALQVTGMPASLRVGGQSVALLVRDAGGPVNAATVAFLKDGDEYRVAHTDATGHATLAVEPHATGNLQVTVTAPDHQAWRATLPVAATGVGLALAGTGLQDASGNGDGRFDAGETVSLGLPLRNSGAVAATGITATLSTTDASIAVLQGASAYPNLAPGAQAAAQSPFQLRADAGIQDGSVVALELGITRAGGTETRRVELLVHAARLRIVSLRLDDQRAGNGDGVQDPNEPVDLFYTLENRGSGAATGLELGLAGSDVGLHVLTGTAALADLPPGATGTNVTPLVLSEDSVDESRLVTLTLRHDQDPAGTTQDFDMRRPSPPLDLRFQPADASDVVHLEWSANPEFDRGGYHVYRSTSPAGPFERADVDLVTQAFYRDVGLQPSTRYHYRVTTVDRGGIEGLPSAVVSPSTNAPQVEGWPLHVGGFTASTPAVGDLDGDDALDIVAAADQVLAWNRYGIELRDADHNALTWGVFYGAGEIYGSATVAHINRTPGREIVVTTWDPELRFVTVIDGSGAALPGWPRNLLPAPGNASGAQTPPVVANVDMQGTPEILVAARDGRLYGWHADGTEIADGDSNPSTSGVLLDTHSLYLRSGPGVADLDPARPGFEIAVGSTDGKLYVLDARGRPLPGWPRTAAGGAPFGALFGGGISIADLDRDGVLEMVCLESSGRLHALHLDGSELAGFPVAGIPASSASAVPGPAIGNLVGDARLEVVVAGVDGTVHVFDSAGHSLLPVPVTAGATTESSPILGDVDGDGVVEIVLGDESGTLHAWNLDGTPVDGFPIPVGSEVRATPHLADVDGDGKADLIVQTWNGTLLVFALGVPWVPERFPWPMHRGNDHRTGEFGFKVPTAVVLSDLEGSFAAGSVALSWRAGPDAAGESVWRIRRAGPFAARPADAAAAAAGAALVGETRGSGALQFRDTGVGAPGWYAYALGAVDAGGEERLAGAIAVSAAPPAVLRLHPAVPNPFNPGTRIAFEVPGGASGGAVPVRLDLYDAQGRLVRALLHTTRAPGWYAVDWNGRDASGRETASGVYIVRLQAGRGVVSNKITRMR